MMKIANRVKELRLVTASELVPNPKNWRTHPEAQGDALRGILAQVGYVDAIKAVETPQGLMIVDGHLRAETTPDAKVPVLVLDLKPKEIDYVLATFDPLTQMAQADDEKMKALLDSVSIESDAVKHMLASVFDETFLSDAIGAGDPAHPWPQFQPDETSNDEDRNVFSVLLTAEERTVVMAAIKATGAANASLGLVELARTYATARASNTQ